jgi:hypothetical protein
MYSKPRERMEPVQAAEDVSEDLQDSIGAFDVRELMPENGALPRGGPIRQSEGQNNDRTKDAPCHG